MDSVVVEPEAASLLKQGEPTKLVDKYVISRYSLLFKLNTTKCFASI